MKSYKGWDIKPVVYHVEGRKNGILLKGRNKHELLKKIHEKEHRKDTSAKAEKDIRCYFCGKRRKEESDLFFSIPGLGRNAHICVGCYKKNYLEDAK